MWGFYCDIESNQVISEPFIFDPIMFDPIMECILIEEPATPSTLYYAGIVLMTLSLIPVNLLFR